MAKFKLEHKYDLPRIEDEQFHNIPFYFSINDNNLNIRKISGYIELANFITQSLPNILSRFTVIVLWVGSIVSFFTIGAFLTAQATTNGDVGMSRILVKVYLTSIPLLYIVANWMMLKKKKLGFYVSTFASLLILVSSVCSSNLGVCLLGVFIFALTCVVLCLKSNERTGFNILGIKK